MSLLPAAKPVSPIWHGLGFLIGSALLSIPLLAGCALFAYSLVALITGQMDPTHWGVPGFVADSLPTSNALPSVAP